MPFALHPQTLRRFAQHTDLLHCLDDAGLVRLAKVGNLQHVPAGTVVLREGDPSYDLYLLAAGEMRVTMRDAPGREMARLQEGAFFGEMAMMTRQPRSATVQATVNAQVVCFPYDAVDAILRDYPQVQALLKQVRSARTQANEAALAHGGNEANANGLAPVGDYLKARPADAAALDAAAAAESFAQDTTPPTGTLPPSLRPAPKR